MVNLEKLEELLEKATHEYVYLMKMNSLLVLPKEGRITLQIPQFVIELDPVKCAALGIKLPPRPTEDPFANEGPFPEEWFQYLSSDDLPTSKARGFMHWSRLGWETNKERIKEVYLASKLNPNTCRQGTWEDFEKHAEEHFQNITKKIEKKRKSLEKQLAELSKYKE